MKKIMLLFALFLSFCAVAQNNTGTQDCNAITSGKTSQGIAFYEVNSEGVMFKKYFEADGISYIIRVNTPSYQEGRKGLSVQLSNNAKIERADAKLSPIDNGIGGKASFAFILLKPEEVELLKHNEILKVTIGGNERDIERGALLKSYYNCLVEKAPLVSAAKSGGTGCTLDTYFDEKTNEINYATPIVDGVILKKVKDIHNNITYIGLVEVKSKTKVTGSGIQLLFENGDFISNPNAKLVEDKLADGSFSYVAVFIIEEKDIYSFALSNLKGGKVATVLKLLDYPGEIKNMARCLIDK